MKLRYSVSVDTHGAKAGVVRACRKAEIALATQILKDTEPFVPASQNKVLSKTAHIETDLDMHPLIVYDQPYARYLYYGKVMKGPKYGPKYTTDKKLVYNTAVHPQAQSFWIRASKAMNSKKWARVAQNAVNRELKK